MVFNAIFLLTVITLYILLGVSMLRSGEATEKYLKRTYIFLVFFVWFIVSAYMVIDGCMVTRNTSDLLSGGMCKVLYYDTDHLVVNSSDGEEEIFEVPSVKLIRTSVDSDYIGDDGSLYISLSEESILEKLSIWLVFTLILILFSLIMYKGTKVNFLITESVCMVSLVLRFLYSGSLSTVILCCGIIVMLSYMFMEIVRRG